MSRLDFAQEQLKKYPEKSEMKIGAVYNTFYDLDMMESSIASIREVVDYIVVVHQRIGFNGQQEEAGNQNYLDKINADKIIYYTDIVNKDKRIGMLEKANVGLQELKRVGCDYYVLMSPDVRVKKDSLKKDIEYMQSNNIDTCYYPIKAYYYDEKHYFIDSYYAAQIYKIDEREFGINNSSVLCDPLTKMQEREYFISENHVHHYTFLKNHYGKKLNNSIRAIGDNKASCDMKLIYDHLMSWKEGDSALVFTNDMSRNGKVILAEKQLETVKDIYKLAICIPFYKREKITRYVFGYYQDLKYRLRSKVDLLLIACGSEGAVSRKIANDYDFNYIEYSNDHLTQKHNAFIMFARIYNPDAYIKTDSDSIIEEGIFDWYIDLLDRGIEYAGIRGIWFMFKDSMAYKTSMPVKRGLEPHGIGRFLSKSLLEKMNWMPWEGRKDGNCIDKILTMNIIKHNPKTEIRNLSELNGMVIDIKSDFQITNIENVTYDTMTDVPKEYLGVSKYSIEFNGVIEKDAYTVIIPTMWVKTEVLIKMIKIYNKNPFVKEIIIIDNNPNESIKISSKKVRFLTEGKNIYVNPAWNWGVQEATTERIIIANDDIYIKDFDNLMNEIQKSLYKGMIIAPDEECFKIEQTNDIKITKAGKERNWGFGTFMVMYKKDYVVIPDIFKLWVGDDIQFHTKNVYNITGLKIETEMSSTLRKYGLRNKGVEEHEYYEKNCNLDGSLKQGVKEIRQVEKINIPNQNSLSVTIGLVYSGRLSNLFSKWMQTLVKDVSILTSRPELIIINNSNEKLETDNYQKYFSQIKILRGRGNVVRTNKVAVAQMLADSYNNIVKYSTNNLIHLREDDIIPCDGSFKKIYEYIVNSNSKIGAVAGLYLNRRIDNKINPNQSISVNNPIRVELTGTGFIIFKKDVAPSFIINTIYKYLHDWNWCHKFKSTSKEIWMIPDAICEHYKSVDNCVIPEKGNQIITQTYTHTKLYDV